MFCLFPSILNVRVDTKASAAGWHFDNAYTRLPDRLFTRVQPVPVRAPKLVVVNHSLAESLGLSLGAVDEGILASMLAGNQLPPGAEPLAQAYAGHQFGHFAMLGDGRAVLLGEQRAPDGRLYDIQLKGSGPTPYSRQGDGRAALAPMLREYLISEAVHALGIATARSLAVVSTGEAVLRNRVLPGAVLTRVAASHVRIGTFEYASASSDPALLRALADFAIARHYPELTTTDKPYRRFLQAVIERQARLVAAWMQVGFVHGVLNTDNVTVSGETLDYGPCAFMDRYDPETVFSSIDRHGRYAYGNQPAIMQWNLARFAETLLPLLHKEPSRAGAMAAEDVQHFAVVYEDSWLTGMRRKLGLLNAEDSDAELVQSLLAWMHRHGADYSHTLRRLAEDDWAGQPLGLKPDVQAWHTAWQARLSRSPQVLENALASMRSVNPAVIPRNHCVEAALGAADEGDLAAFHRLLAVLTKPFNVRPEDAAFCQPPPPDAPAVITFCGT